MKIAPKKQRMRSSLHGRAFYEYDDIKTSYFPEPALEEEQKDIHVTKTFLPPVEEYLSYLRDVWESGWVTNHGPLLTELQKKLKRHLDVKHLFVVNNGTIALQAAIKALGLRGEIITTPFSYVATTSSIVWEGCTPVFTDIHPKTFCLDPELIEEAITPKTTAILATHVYGNPCDVNAIEMIASRHNLKVIYDAAHAFNVRLNGTSLLNFGDVSTLSFHATKLFHTIEGGAIITNNDAVAHRLSYMTNFGHNGPEHIAGLGINCKNSELHAAMGLCVLPRVRDLIERRREASMLYNFLLADQDLIRPVIAPGVSYNFAYYPVLFPSEKVMFSVKKALNKNRIFPRRYFYPPLNTLPYVKENSVQVAEDVASRVLCLPLYYELSNDEITRISQIIGDHS